MRFILECDAESPRAAGLLQWYQSLGLSERWLEVRPWTSESTLRDLREAGWRTTLALKAHPRTRRRHHAHKGHAAPDPEEVLRRHHAAWGGAANVVWQALLEDDSSGVSFPQELLAAPVKTRAEWLRRLEEYLAEAREEWSRWHDGPVWGLAGFGGSAHAYARAGIQALMVERANDDCDDLQTGLAFARGAARQHGIDWGVDLSLWWGPIHGCVEQLPAHYHVQVLLASWAAGATHYRLEGGDLWVDASGQPTRIARELGPVIQFIDRLGPCDPPPAIAVVLPRDHAFMTGSAHDPSPIIGSYAKLRPELPSLQIAAFFNAAFPGCAQERDPFPFGAYEVDEPPASPFALSCVTPRFSPRASDVHSARPTLPFGRFRSRDEAREWMLSSGANPADYRPLATNQWVDPIDVLTDDVLDSPAGAALLARYKEVQVLGDVEITPRRRARLEEGVRGGAHVTWFVGSFGPADSQLTGVLPDGTIRQGHRWERPSRPDLELMGLVDFDCFRFAGATLATDDAELVAAEASGRPLTVSRQVGEGELVSCLVPWGLAANGTLLDGVGMGLWDRDLRMAHDWNLEIEPVLMSEIVLPGKATSLFLLANVDSAWIDVDFLASPVSGLRDVEDDEELEASSTQVSMEAHGSVILAVGTDGGIVEVFRFE